MTDLQKALDKYARGDDVTPAQVLQFAKAARLVANPNIEAMAAVELNYIDFYGDQSLWRKGDGDNPITVGDLFADEFRDEALRLIVAAALTLGDTE